MDRLFRFLRPEFLTFTGTGLFLWVLMTVLLHRFGLTWTLATADSGIHISILGISIFVVTKTFRFYAPKEGSLIYRGLFVVLLTVITSAVTRLILSNFFAYNPDYLSFLQLSMPLRGVFNLLIISMMGTIQWLQHYMRIQEENKRRKDEAEVLLREAELTRLRQQLQPHFLFNSLNSISALAVAKPEEARRMVHQLSEFLRGTLHKDEQKLVPLADELRHLQLYLEIEKVRFGNRLQTVIESDEQSNMLRLPSLILQPVVENAIKFGLYDTIGEITIHIRASHWDHMLEVEVTNPYDPDTSAPVRGTGFGLSSIRRRLYLLYARQDLLQTHTQDHTFITRISIPQLS